MRNNIGTKKIDIDKTNYTPIATIKQEDNVIMKLELYKDGEAFDITRQTVTLAAKRSDKVIIEQIDGFSIDTNSLTIELKNNINAKIGLVYLELNIKDETGSMTTLDFYLKVVGKILGEDSLDASDNIASLEKIQDEFIKSSNALLDTVIKNEDDRVDAEAIRQGDESTRSENEASRINAESERMQAENARVIAEQERASAEVVREEKINEFGSQVTKNKNDIKENAKDIERAFETINDNSFIPFEGENISVEHSKVGFTKDMQIEGMTYQNLLQSKKYWNSSSNQVEFRTIFKIEGSKILTACNRTNKKIIAFIYDNSTQNYITTDISANSNIKIELTSSQYLRDLRGTSSDGWKETDIESVIDVLLLEGDYNNQYIPDHFEGSKSVGELENEISFFSCGKNLCSINKLEKDFEDNQTWFDLKGNDANLIKINTFLIKIKKEGLYYLNVKGLETVSDFQILNKDFSHVVSPNKIVTLKKDEYLIRFKQKADTKTSLCDIQLEKKNFTSFEPYKCNKKEILLPFEDGLKGLLNGAKDSIVLKEDGLYVRQNINKIIFNGNEENIIKVTSYGDVIRFDFILTDIKPSSKLICNKIKLGRIGTQNLECINVHGESNFLQIQIKADKLETQDVTGFKKWLKANQITVYYELAEPVEHKITDLNSINLETFKDITYISSENEIQPNLSFKAPVDIPATISTLKAANTMLIAQNVGLENKNTELEKVNNQQNKALKELNDTTSFLIEDSLSK